MIREGEKIIKKEDYSRHLYYNTCNNNAAKKDFKIMNCNNGSNYSINSFSKNKEKEDKGTNENFWSLGWPENFNNQGVKPFHKSNNYNFGMNQNQNIFNDFGPSHNIFQSAGYSMIYNNFNKRQQKFIDNSVGYSPIYNEIIENKSNFFNPIINEFANMIPSYYKINIKFIKFSDYSAFNCYKELKGLLKLCLLNEIASKIEDSELDKDDISKNVYFIMKILKDSYVKSTDKNQPGKVIEKIMEKENGSNIINFSNIVEEQIDQH